MSLKYIKSDLLRYDGSTSIKSFIKNYLFNRGFNFSFWLRLANPERTLWYLFYPIYMYKKRKYSLDISHRTQIGYGLYIGHGGPLVINPTATLGNNVNLSQYTSIGSNKGKAAEIGDNVYIGPNVCIIENVKIGCDSTIGAGSVVTKDVPANATVAGNYAKVLNFNEPGKYIHNKWYPVVNKQS